VLALLADESAAEEDRVVLGGETVNKLKLTGISMIALGKLTNEEWLLVLSIIITVLGMIQDYLKNRKTSRDQTMTNPSRVNG